ncbi:unnamed protein product [Phytophthora fragariaefolia]|uniref:Unnamed protein product n=1 Tax=Phytophthora fragariaefolia TaxID=1490495 RepID=A0A9W7D1T4_9STRA|nr:unnamed protein product [Phytophthora fragariaefolia]
MTTQGNVRGLDELGQEVLWSSQGQQVMMQWEKQYMQLCVDALGIRPSDRVLEIGFGLAYSASHIQTFRPRSHTIIECDQETLQRAQRFAATHAGVEIVAGTWQHQLPTLNQFDCVFFDDYPLPELAELVTRTCAVAVSSSRWHDFLDVALKHCASGARVSGYLACEVDLKRPGCRVATSKLQVAVSENCNYFPHKTALIPVITVVDPLSAAGGASAEVVSLTFLPSPSKKFKRAFENASKPELLLPHATSTLFSRQKAQIAGIRDFLLAHEMDALSHRQPGMLRDEDDGGSNANNATSEEKPPQDEDLTSSESNHYSDGQSRREFLSILKRRAAASKQQVG